MKTILFITREESQRALYERGLKEHFQVTVCASRKDAPDEVDAVVYDQPKYQSAAELHWVEALGVPVVVLTPDARLRVPRAAKSAVLVYPMVRMDEILEALVKLGVCLGEEC